MLISALICFGIAIILGLSILMHVAINKKPPRFLVFTHGPFALAGIILLLIYTVANVHTPLIIAVFLFILAALGGLTLFYKDIGGKKIPKWLAVLHGTFAFCTFLFLVIYLSSNGIK